MSERALKPHLGLHHSRPTLSGPWLSGRAPSLTLFRTEARSGVATRS
jgi:hypothetical protein